MDKKMIFTSSCVEIAEHKDYLELENLVCYYNYPNANGRQMNYGKTKEEHAAALEMAKSLLLMPVYAKCAVNRKGEPTFKGHEITRDNKGNLQFGTIPIGVHHKVRIKKADVVAADGTPQNLPCLFATQKIWKRNKNAVAAIRRLFAEGKLFNSWEIDVEKYQYSNGVKYLEEYSFLGNTFLGYEYASPAYGTGGGAKVLSVASQEILPDAELSETELMLAEALYQDELENGRDEVSEAMELENFEVTVEEVSVETEVSADMEQPAEESVPAVSEEENEEEVESEAEIEATDEEAETESEQEAEDSAEVSEEVSEQDEPVSEQESPVEEISEEETSEEEVSMLTSHDLHRALERALNAKNSEYYRSVSHLFPAENIAWIRQYSPEMKELDFTEVVYEVNGDEVSIVSETPVTLVASPREFASLMAKKDEQISALEQEISELKVVKNIYDSMMAAKEEKDHRAAVNKLREYAEKSGCFTPEELGSPEISSLIETLNETEIKVKIAERVVASKMETSEQAETPVEASTVAPKMGLDYEPESIEKRRSRMWASFIGK